MEHLYQKISAVARASFESDEVYSQLKEKIRHLYDIYHLIREDEIKAFLNSDDMNSMIQSVREDTRRIDMLEH